MSLTYTEWTRTSAAYQAWVEASRRCAAAFQEHTMTDRPTITANEWTHPRTGETRYYLNSDEVAAAIGFDADAKSFAGVDEHLRNREVRDIETYIESSKFWVGEDGELHVKSGSGLYWQYEEAITDRLREARIAKTAPQAKKSAQGRTGWSKYSRRSNDGGVGAMLGRTSPATGAECHYCGLDSRTCDCR